MEPEPLSRVIRRLRAAPIDGSRMRAPEGACSVEELIPHRPPFLFVDGITGFDPEVRSIAGWHSLDPDDPLFRGHFPHHPVFPGVLQVEAMSQLALCLLGLMVSVERRPVDARALKIHHALFVAEASPGDRLDLRAQTIEEDGLTATIAGQVSTGRGLCSIAIMEAYLVET